MDRRTFMLGAAAAAFCLGRGTTAGADLDRWLLEEVSGSPDPRDPAAAGPLAGRELRSLLGLFRHVGVRWDMAEVGRVGEHHLASLLHPKSEQQPSYRTEYREAVAILDRIRRHTGRIEDGYDRLLAAPPEADRSVPCTRLGRAHRFVGAELIAWYVAQGGFRRFGYANYRGFMGGLLAASPPPYRTG